MLLVAGNSNGQSNFERQQYGQNDEIVSSGKLKIASGPKRKTKPHPQLGHRAKTGSKRLIQTTRPRLFPLTAGDTWQWKVIRITGAGFRFLGMTNKPAKRKRIARWQLVVGEARSDGRYPITWTRTPEKPALPSTTSLFLFHDANGQLLMDAGHGIRAAISMDIPPNPASVERIPCTLHFLDGLSGLCSPAPGGPLGIAPGADPIWIHRERDGNRTIMRFLVGISTVGMFIPGSRATSEIAMLTNYRTKRPKTPPLSELAIWRKSPRLVNLKKRGPLDLEVAAAMVMLARQSEVARVVAVLARRVSPEAHWTLMRVAMQNSQNLDTRLEVIARVQQTVKLLGKPKQIASVLARLPDKEHKSGLALLRGEWPFLQKMLLIHASGRRANIKKIIKTSVPTGAEVEAVVRLFDQRVGTNLLPVAELMLPHLTQADADRLMLAILGRRGLFESRFSLLQKQTGWLARQTNDRAVRTLLKLFSFDNERQRVLELLLAQALENRKPNLIKIAVQAMSFDKGRIEILRQYPQYVAQMSKKQRAEAAAAFVFAKAEGRALLRP
jgi:hypothetical protein